MIVRVLIAAWLLHASVLFGAETRIIKVLPQLLDTRGRNALTPSLFDRDAYQVVLRENPAQVSALRFDVQFKAKQSDGPLQLRLELRGSKTELGKRHIFETEVKPARWFASWGRIQLDRTTSETIGSVVAWRATLLREGVAVAEQESFLW